MRNNLINYSENNNSFLFLLCKKWIYINLYKSNITLAATNVLCKNIASNINYVIDMRSKIVNMFSYLQYVIDNLYKLDYNTKCTISCIYCISTIIYSKIIQIIKNLCRFNKICYFKRSMINSIKKISYYYEKINNSINHMNIYNSSNLEYKMINDYYRYINHYYKIINKKLMLLFIYIHINVYLLNFISLTFNNYFKNISL